jgi:hypothetical protein
MIMARTNIPEVQLALPLHHPAWQAQSVDGLVGRNRLNHLSHILAGHVRSPSVLSRLAAHRCVACGE